MRPPYKSEDELQERYVELSEVARLEFHRRLNEAQAAGLAAFFCRAAAKEAESSTFNQRKQDQRFLLLVVVIGCVSVALSWLFPSTFSRNAAWLVAGVWAIYAIITNTIVLPNLEATRQSSYRKFEVLASRWGGLVGASLLAEQLDAIERSRAGATNDDMEPYWLALRGSILVKIRNLDQI